jgi:SAM-dependent methyltransferase
MACVLCKGNVLEPIGWGYPASHLICKGCGLVSNPVLYEKHKYKENYRETKMPSQEYIEDQYMFQKERIEFILCKIQKKKGRVLDIGCSIGQLLMLFRECGWECMGIEPTNAFADWGRKNGLDIIDGFFPNNKIKGKFNLIILVHVFEHMSNPNEMIHSIAKLLVPGGHAFIEVPDVMHPQEGMRFLCPEHCFTYSGKTLGWMLEKNGMKPIYLETTSGRFTNLRILAVKSRPTKIKLDAENYERTRKALDVYKKKEGGIQRQSRHALENLAIKSAIRICGRKNLRKLRGFASNKQPAGNKTTS